MADDAITGGSAPARAAVDQHPTGFGAGMVAGAEWISAASFIGLAGTLYVLGYDGLAFVLGWMGGIVLLAVLIAPRLRRSGATTLPAYFAARFGGTLAPRLAALAVAVSSFVFLVAQLHGAGLIVIGFTGFDHTTSILLGLTAVLAAWGLSALDAPTGTRVALCVMLLVAYLAPAMLLSAERYGLPLAPLTYGQALQDIATQEKNLIAQRLADVRVLKPHTQPFATTDAWNFFALIACLAAGTASFPLLMKHGTRASASDTGAAYAWLLLCVFLICVTAPAYAAFVKLELYSTVIGQPLAQLPGWIYTWGNSLDPMTPGQALVNICGKAATDAQAVAAHCGPGRSAALRLQDLAIDPDVILIAAPEIARMPRFVGGVLMAGGLAAALLTASALLWIIAGAAAGFDPGSTVERPSTLGRLGLAGAGLGAALLAAFAALWKPGDLLTVSAWAFSLAAAGLFPALVLGIGWRRTTAWGCAAGIAVGLGLTLYYLVGTRYFSVAFFETWGTLSSASEIAAHKFATLKQAWLKAPEGPAQAAAWTALDAHARTIANWWGMRNLSAGLFGLLAGFVSIGLVSLAGRPPSRGP